MATVCPTLEELREHANAVFMEEFKTAPTHAACCPGRVNLIGEHIDYCDGFVLPMALPLLTVVVGTPIEGTLATIVTDGKSVDEPHKGSICMPGKDAVRKYCVSKPKWLNYIKGVVVQYKGFPPAFNAVIVSSVPVGGGLSSSAALELAFYTFLDALAGPNDVLPVDRALACVEAEHEYGEVPCGIMDQFVGQMGQEGHALLIDCKDHTISHIPFNEKKVVVLITNSNVKHSLDGSEYPTRRKQCEQAAELLQLKSLRDAVPEDISKLESLGADKDVVKRARHVIGEIKRTQDAAEALRQKDFDTFGKLMKESHNSLKDDFEVSCPEVDSLVEIANKSCGVFGSRMTGGGFGGCTVTLVNKTCAEKVIKNITSNYKGTPTFFICQASQGARIL